jgi:23S rRNA pseudouridine1911/1915/1917 synthase
MTDRDASIHVQAELSGQTLAAIVRQLTQTSWSEARQAIASRRVTINGSVCLNDARRLTAGEVVAVNASAGKRDLIPPTRLLHVDDDLVVVEKPPGITATRRHEERHWDQRRKLREPALDEAVQRLLPGSPVRAVHRLDRDTSGLMILARSAQARQRLIDMFAKHEVRRVYRAIVHGHIEQPVTFDTMLARNRGDGVRGSLPAGASDPEARRAVTHVRPIQSFGNLYSMVECRLETGRTHQIRIHLAEAGHVLCGEKVYTRSTPAAPQLIDQSGAPRQALHSTEIEFSHPITGKLMRFASPLPPDLQRWLTRRIVHAPK